MSMGIWRTHKPQTAPVSMALPFFSAHLPLWVKYNGCPLTLWRPYLKMKACVWQTDHNICKHSLSAYRVHGQGWVGEAAKGRRRWVRWGQQCFSQLPLLMGKNDQEKWDHNGARRNSPQALEHRTVILAKRGFRCSLYNKGETTKDGGEKGQKMINYTTPAPSTMGWDALQCV